MEMEILYRKEYSALPRIQTARSAQYALLRGTVNERVVYGVRTTEFGSGWIEHGECFPLTVLREEAERVAAYLFENAVSANHCQAVALDLASALDGSEFDGERPHPALDCG